MNDASYLDSVEDVQTSSLMESVRTNVKRLQELHWAMIEAEEAYNKAKEAYEAYSRSTMPDIFKMNGITTLTLDDGQKVSVVTKTSASMKKSEEAKRSVCDWLEKQGVGHMVKRKCIVPDSCIEVLKEYNIMFEEDVSVNTNSLKAFLISALGQKESPATITLQDIPDGINFYQWDEMEITK